MEQENNEIDNVKNKFFYELGRTHEFEVSDMKKEIQALKNQVEGKNELLKWIYRTVIIDESVPDGVNRAHMTIFAEIEKEFPGETI